MKPDTHSTARRPLPRDLQLDFLKKTPAIPVLSWVLLAVGLVLICAVIWTHYRFTQEVAQERRVLARLVQSGGNAGRGANGDSLLRKPWGTLFVTLEKSRPKAIALIQLEASAETGQLSLLAETHSSDDMLDYVKQLRNQAGFSNVALVRHATLDDASDRPVQFTVRLGWAAP
jgi:nitrate reductase NapAB chaperone NapD